MPDDFDRSPVADAIAQWLGNRAGKLTASAGPRAFAKTRQGWAKSRADLQREILAERLTGSSVRHFVNDAMQHGLEQEGPALDAYEAITGTLVTRTQYTLFDHPRIDMLAATPDAMVGDGLIEVKCPTTPKFIDWRLGGSVPEEHKTQMLIQLACTGKRWCDFVAFDPRVRGGLEAQLFIRRFTPTGEDIIEIEGLAREFLAEVDELWERLTTT